MKRVENASLLVSTLVLTVACIIVPSANAELVGTVATPPGSTVFPGLVPTGTDPGTLLASLVELFTTSPGTAGTLTTAVFREAGGTLDFYYQLADSAGSIDSLARETDTNFTGFTTSTGFRTDGASLAGGLFVNGTVAPVTADRNSPLGDVVGFSFSPPDSAKILPGTSSEVFVISTDATNFAAGHASMIDGGTITVAAFEPASPSTVPEPTALIVPLVIGLIVLARQRARSSSKA